MVMRGDARSGRARVEGHLEGRAAGRCDGGGGRPVTVKSAALVPLIATSGVPERVRAPVPVFWIVKVRVTVPPVTSALPKSVKSAAEGVASPSAMATALPTTLISGAVAPVPWIAKS